ncbi:hypothetical protein PI124_g18386 [Phytophthora idaei]|nr:hypothetical protein PI125_g19138 [Phytophthora idaei]KAG3136616.1 hypothetical protein PI126_g17740 [Phytophthora idaei]KAG3236608.1 hypothetical protein PI124_g18386 [Phytophthora idaei]
MKVNAAMAFASTVNRSKWVVTWIHVSKSLKWQCVRLVGEECKTRTIEIADVDELLQIDDDTRHHLVLVDGWTPADSFQKLTVTCCEWFLEEDHVKQRRLAYICLAADRGKI